MTVKAEKANSITVRFDHSLYVVTNNTKRVLVESAGDIRELLTVLAGDFPALGNKLFDKTGRLRKLIIVSVNGKDIRMLDGEKTTLKGDEDVLLLHAVGGG